MISALNRTRLSMRVNVIVWPGDSQSVDPQTAMRGLAARADLADHVVIHKIADALQEASGGWPRLFLRVPSGLLSLSPSPHQATLHHALALPCHACRATH